MTIDQVVPLVSVRKVGDLLGVPPVVLLKLANRGDELYRPFSMKKKKGSGVRNIDNPIDRLKLVQKRIYQRLLKLAPLPPFVMGGVPGRSVRHNAEPHVRQPWVVSVDIKNFFPSITTKHVEQVWRQVFQTGKKATWLLTRLTTFSGHLPQGAPTSTALANLILSPALQEFERETSVSKVSVSSWVDDIVFSGNEAPMAINPLARILSRQKFRVARGKTRAMHGGERQEATGIVLNRKPSVGRDRKRMLRDAMRTLSSDVDTDRERGLIAHTFSICESQGKRLVALVSKRKTSRGAPATPGGASVTMSKDAASVSGRPPATS